MQFLFKFKLRGFEKQLSTAQRVSYYTEEAAGMRLLGQLKRAYEAADYRGAVATGYALVTRYDDLNTAYHYLAKSLEKLGESELALKHYFNGVLAGRKALDAIDDAQVDDLLKLAANLGATDRVRGWFEEAGKRDAKTRAYLERLRMLGRV